MSIYKDGFIMKPGIIDIIIANTVFIFMDVLQITCEISANNKYHIHMNKYTLKHDGSFFAFAQV